MKYEQIGNNLLEQVRRYLGAHSIRLESDGSVWAHCVSGDDPRNEGQITEILRRRANEGD